MTGAAFAQSTQDTNTYPGSPPNTAQDQSLNGQTDQGQTGATGSVNQPTGSSKTQSGSSGYDTEGGANKEMPKGSGSDPSGPGPNDQ